MHYLDEIAFRWLGPGTNGVTLLIGGLLIFLVVALLFLLKSLLLVPHRHEVEEDTVVSNRRTASWSTARPSAVALVSARNHSKSPDDSDVFYRGSQLDKRAAGYRRPGNAVAVQIVAADDTENVETGWIQDRSTGGLGLEMDREVDVHTILKVRPTAAAVTTPWVEVEVRNCRLVDHRYHVGTQFVRKPSWDVMLSFG